MKIRLFLSFIMMFSGFLMLSDGLPLTEGKITKFRIDKYENGFFGKLYITIGNIEKAIADTVIDAWIVTEGKEILFSKPDGSGGFENEGQSLRIYNANSEKVKLLLSEYYMINDVKEVSLNNAKNAFLVRMSDGGLGGQYVAVVSPIKGEVYIAKLAKVLSVSKNIVEIGFYKQDDAWGSSEEIPDKNIKPYKKKKFDLNILLKNKTIKNKRSF